MQGLEMFNRFIQHLEGEDRVEAQVVADGFKVVEALNRNARDVTERARAHQRYEQTLKAAYQLIGRLFLEGRINHIPDPRAIKNR